MHAALAPGLMLSCRTVLIYVKVRLGTDRMFLQCILELGRTVVLFQTFFVVDCIFLAIIRIIVNPKEMRVETLTWVAHSTVCTRLVFVPRLPLTGCEVGPGLQSPHVSGSSH